MARGFWSHVGGAVFWNFRRGSWQYDLIVVAILAFIFLTPRAFFGDQPRPPRVQEIRELGDSSGTVVFWIDAAMVDAAGEAERDATLREALKARTGRSLEIVSVAPAPDPDDELRAYIVHARP